MPTTRFLWDPVDDNIVQSRNDIGSTTTFTTSPGRGGCIVSVIVDGDLRYLHNDALGSVLAATNSTQGLVGNWSYSAFGETAESSGTSVSNLLFRGHLGYRYLPSLAIYTSRLATFRSSIGRTWARQVPINNAISSYAPFAASPTQFFYLVSDEELYSYVQVDLSVRPLLHQLLSPPRRTCPKVEPMEIYQQWDFVVTSTRQTLTATDTGGFVVIETKGGAPCNGFIVQLVNVDCSVDTCGFTISDDLQHGQVTKHLEYKGVKNHPFAYYEAWPVDEGATLHDRRDDVGYTDIALWRINQNPTKGHCTQEGEIRFYCGDYKAKDGGSSAGTVIKGWGHTWYFGEYPCISSAGNLLSRNAAGTPPSFWEDSFWIHERAATDKMPRSMISFHVPQFRRFGVRWDCCCTPVEKRFVDRPEKWDMTARPTDFVPPRESNSP